MPLLLQFRARRADDAIVSPRFRTSEPPRADIPRRIRDLYPRARVRARLHVIQPGEVVHDDRLFRYLRRAMRLTLFLIFVAPMLLATRVNANAIAWGDEVSRRLTASAFRVRPYWLRWEGWARARGGRRTAELPPSQLLDDDHVELPSGGVPSYRLLVGRRHVPMHVASLSVRDDMATHHGAYVAHVQLPDEVADRFPASSLVRRRSLGLADKAPWAGHLLELESIRLVDDARLLVTGGDELDWRALMDPALIDLLAEGIHVEWVQRGTSLLLHSPATMTAVRQPEAARLDALAVAAAAIERRMATIAGDGRAVEPAVPPYDQRVHRAMSKRHLHRARQADLAMTIDEQFEELAKYTSADEVERVRAAIDAGTFRVDHLDDLIHHRRASMWGEIDSERDAA